MTRTSLLLTFCLIVSALTRNANAVFCPLCQVVSATLSERMHQSDAVVLVRLVKSRKPTEQITGQTVFEVVKVVKNADGTMRKKDRITLTRYYPAKKNEQFLMLGKQEFVVEWGLPIPVTKASIDYLTQAPPFNNPRVRRLSYYLKFLEHADLTIANDAYAEFAIAPYKDVRAIRKKIPRQKVHQWVKEGKLSSPRMSFNALLLGLSGNDQDADLLKKRILEPGEEFRLGLDGLMAGYLLLNGEEALEFLEEKISNDKTRSYSETFAVMKSLRFLWQYEPGRIPKDRMRQSMRLLLDRPEIVDLVIADLSRWEDWSIQDRLMKMFDDKEFDLLNARRAIVRYFHTCANAFDRSGPPPKHVLQARRNLELLRKKDPKLVKSTGRLYLFK